MKAFYHSRYAPSPDPKLALPGQRQHNLQTAMPTLACWETNKHTLTLLKPQTQRTKITRLLSRHHSHLQSEHAGDQGLLWGSSQKLN